MTGRVWQHRQIRRGDYELEVDGTIAGFVSLQHGVDRPSLLMQRITAAVAAHHGDIVATRAGVDWKALGWTDQAEHDALVESVAERVARWDGHALGPRCRMWVTGEKQRAGIPAHPPYTVDHLDELDRIVERAPTIVAQDVAAEGGTAA